MSPKGKGKADPTTALIDELVAAYSANQEKLSVFLGSVREILMNSRELGQVIHSIKWRMKEPSHLRDKLERKALKAAEAGETLDITPEDLFVRINDLVGFRILHLYTRQMEQINPLLLDLLGENMIEIVEGPTARTWDDESRQYFRTLDITTIDSESLYTSVHYVIGSHSRTRYTAEIQVRTLAEELWGEVDHSINYPRPSPLLACQEQIKVLARVTSSCTRLVDSIFRAHEEQPAPKPGKH
jgi:ppGpp synthetase/RelA/SpoT-type nucleotidyltranferase